MFIAYLQWGNNERKLIIDNNFNTQLAKNYYIFGNQIQHTTELLSIIIIHSIIIIIIVMLSVN